MLAARPAPRAARWLPGSVLLALGLAAAGCSSDKPPQQPPPALCPAPDGGGPAAGPADDHCTDTSGTKIVQSIGACQVGNAVDAGATDGGADAAPVTRYGTSASDDDCKYDVSYGLDCAAHGSFATTLTVMLTSRSDGSPVDGANTSAEVYLSDTHITSGRMTTTALGGGKYAISGVAFDAPGLWQIRFHFFETCNDTPADSPHGHVTFYVNVL
jgi:hypothetical protein